MTQPTNICLCDLPTGTPHVCADERQSEVSISFIDETDLEDCSEMARQIAPLVLDELARGKHYEDTPHGRALTAAVFRAVDSLEGQGARSERIALQLLEALARYELELTLCTIGRSLAETVSPEAGPVGYVEQDPPCIVRGEQ